MRRFLVHIGAAKTGTTAFQMWLKAHRQELLDAGYLTPSRSPTLGNNRGLLEALASPDRDDPKLATLRSGFLKEAAAFDDHDIVMSAEALSRPDGLIDGSGLSIAMDALADTKIAILVVRDPVAHFNSGFAQRRKAMRENSRDYAEYFEGRIAEGRADWRALVERYDSLGFEVVVLPYDRDFNRRGAVCSILSHAVFGDLASRFNLSTPTIGNPSMGAIGLIVMDLILDRALSEDPGEKPVAPQKLRETVARIAAEQFADRPFNGITSAMRATLIARRAEANAWIAERYFDAAWDEVLPPAPDVPLSPRTLDDLPTPIAAEVRQFADRMIAWCRQEGWLDLRPAG